MGDRGNIRFEYEDGNVIYFYGHWSGGAMFEILQKALERGRDRWDDESYLARIVFCEMLKDDPNGMLGLTGFGISPYICDNEYPILAVNCQKKLIRMWTERALEGKGLPKKEWNFEEFIVLERDPRISDE